MSEVQVWVSQGDQDVHAGTLYTHRRRGAESATFTYAGPYLARDDAYALDPALALRSGSHHTAAGQKLFGALIDGAPDRWGRTLVNRCETALARGEGRAPRALAEVDYLLGVRDDLRQGAVRFQLDGGPFVADEVTGVPALTDLPALLDLADRAEVDRADLADLQRLVRAGSSLGGARPKAHVRDAEGRIAIAKFPSADHDTWDVMAWEKVALDLASHAGISVPASRLLDLAGRSVLVIDRFDRTAAGDRIGYVSAMTMLEATDGDQRSYVEIAEVIERTSSRTTRDLHELWRRIVFTVLISNTDDHLRNHGFVHERGEVWRLSPAFDLNPDPQPGPTFLSTSIDDGDDAASVRLVLAVAGVLRLSSAQAHATLGEVTAAVSGWQHVAASHGLTAKAIQQMQPAFSALEDVP